jgi:hypothetical protein
MRLQKYQTTNGCQSTSDSRQRILYAMCAIYFLCTITLKGVIGYDVKGKKRDHDFNLS